MDDLTTREKGDTMFTKRITEMSAAERIITFVSNCVIAAIVEFPMSLLGVSATGQIIFGIAVLAVLEVVLDWWPYDLWKRWRGKDDRGPGRKNSTDQRSVHSPD